jgi:integrase
MPALKRFSASYPGVTFIMGTSIRGKPEKIFYIRYRKAGKMIEEKAGRAGQDAMTAAKAAQIRAERISGKQLSNTERREKAAQQKAQKAGKWTVKKLWHSYKENNLIKGIVTDQNRFELHIEPVMGDKEPLELVPLDIDRMRLKLQKGHKAATVRNTLELFRRIINYGVKKRLVSPLPFKIGMPKVSNLKTEDLSPGQLQALLKAIGEDVHPLAGPMMKFVLFTGMRRGELFSLRWKDVDFERGFISIREPKGGQDVKIPMNAEARAILESLTRESEYCFPGRGGERRVDINKAVNAIKKAAGLPKNFRALHGLRHTYASMLASSGQVDLYTLQKLLTHRSPLMTQRYAHLRDQALRQAANLAGEIVTGATSQKDEQKTANVVELRK